MGFPFEDSTRPMCEAQVTSDPLSFGLVGRLREVFEVFMRLRRVGRDGERNPPLKLLVTFHVSYTFH